MTRPDDRPAAHRLSRHRDSQPTSRQGPRLRAVALLIGAAVAAGCAGAGGPDALAPTAPVTSPQPFLAPARPVLEVPTTLGNANVIVPTTTAGPVITLPPAAVASIPGGIEVTFGDALLHFPAGSADIRVADLPLLDAAAQRIRDGGYHRVHVTGHTSSEGTGNDALSQQRADRVAVELRHRLPDTTVTITAAGAGASATTIDDIADPTHRNENRRVIITALP